MGAKQKIDELEERLEICLGRMALYDEVVLYIWKISEIPTDGIINYTEHGMQIQFDIVNSAKEFLKRLRHEQP